MKNFEQIKKLRKNAKEIKDLFNDLIPKWQADPRMRFVLREIKDNKARLSTRTTNKSFWTNINDLIFIETTHNKNKANKINNGGKFKK